MWKKQAGNDGLKLITILHFSHFRELTFAVLHNAKYAITVTRLSMFELHCATVWGCVQNGGAGDISQSDVA